MSLRLRCPGDRGTPAQEGAGAREVRAGSLDFPLQAPGTHSSVNVFFLIDIVTFLYINEDLISRCHYFVLKDT